MSFKISLVIFVLVAGKHFVEAEKQFNENQCDKQLGLFTDGLINRELWAVKRRMFSIAL